MAITITIHLDGNLAYSVLYGKQMYPNGLNLPIKLLAFFCVFCFVIVRPKIVLRVLKSMKEWKRNKRSHITGSLQAEEGVHKGMKRRERQVKQLSVKPPTL